MVSQHQACSQILETDNHLIPHPVWLYEQVCRWNQHVTACHGIILSGVATDQSWEITRYWMATITTPDLGAKQPWVLHISVFLTGHSNMDQTLSHTMSVFKVRIH